MHKGDCSSQSSKNIRQIWDIQYQEQTQMLVWPAPQTQFFLCWPKFQKQCWKAFAPQRAEFLNYSQTRKILIGEMHKHCNLFDLRLEAEKCCSIILHTLGLCNGWSGGMRITAPTISPMVVFFGYDSQVEISSKWGKAVKVPKRYQTTKLDLRGI
ncbi:Guanine Nucleotide-Binding Protein G(I)/G(S)/G(T) Subunit Beta-3 [Manis pentadactyla]|nr:Guanine Nucleotide-Binding Protein G(I)/G(S)/G(T) Subunit Beta-3 [Manis pentadactyla]